MKGMIIAATSSNGGKTSITLGLMSLLKRKGYAIYPFKIGPDYIDPQYHKAVTGNDSNNLDEALMPKEAIVDQLGRVPEDGIAIAEGVMGLFDGINVDRLEGSTASMAVLSGLPIILVVDGRGQSQSIAATVKGFMSLYASVTIAGVIINRINTQRHFQLLEDAIRHHCGVECIGYVPNVENMALKSRHLGLFQAHEVEDLTEKVSAFADQLEKTLDIDKLLRIADIGGVFSHKPIEMKAPIYRLGVAMDEAFTFYYPYNFHALKENGIELVPFSPMHDRKIPDVDGIYLGGGYPEIYAEKLSHNTSMLKSIKDALSKGLPCYAECGGYMYLNASIKTLEGESYPMVGYLSGKASMTKRLQRFGYVEVTVEGHTMRGHEFHRSIVEGNDEEAKPYDVSFLSATREGKWKSGVRKQAVLAAYPHLHFASASWIIEFLLKEMKAFKENEQ